MSILERYEKLGLCEALRRNYRYPWACNELSFVLRWAYQKVPKNLQAIIFNDTLSAFRLLPHQVHRSRGLSAANFLLQAAEVALPKQKKSLALTEFKHAVIAHKRRSKAPQEEEEEGSAQLPQDVLLHVFSFLDMRSLVAVGLVCWSWNLASNDNRLWQSQFNLFFGNSNLYNESKELIGKSASDPKNLTSFQKKQGMDPVINRNWREAFKRTYTGNSSWRSASNRGYCWHCKSIIWLSNMKCANLHHISKFKNYKSKIKPISSHKVIEYLLDGSLSTLSSSDSDSDSEEVPLTEQRLHKLWAYRLPETH